MKRIGVAASKISKGNTSLYNFLVVLISCLVSLFLFVVVASTVIFALAIIAYVTGEIMPSDYRRNWDAIRMVCISVLASVMAVFNLLAIFINIKLPNKFTSHD
jgi:hypothetical protein